MNEYINTLVGIIIMLVVFVAVRYSITPAVANGQKPTEVVEKIDVLDTIYDMARMKNDDLVETGEWDHTNSDNCDLRCRIMRSDAEGWVGENLYRIKDNGDRDIRKAIEQFEQSEPHKAILDHEYDNGVILITRDGDVCYITMVVRKAD